MRILKFKRGKEDNGDEGDHPEQALALVQKDRELLGDRLVQAGHIDEHQLNTACEASVSDGKRLAQVLVEQKLVSASIVLKVMKAHLQTVPALEGENVPLGQKQLEGQLDASPLTSSSVGSPSGIEPPSGESPRATKERGLGTMADESLGRGIGLTGTFRARAENAAEVMRNVLLTVTRLVHTELEIEEKVYPNSISEDELTEVLYIAIVKNTRRAMAKSVTLTLGNLPPWFEPSEVTVDGETILGFAGELTSLEIGDIAPGESKSIVIVGTASP